LTTKFYLLNTENILANQGTDPFYHRPMETG